MTVEIEAGYTLPANDMPLKHARILHKGGIKRVKTVTASSEVASYPGIGANNPSTVDRWKPFSNQLSAPSDFSDTDEWAALRFVVGADGNTLDEGADAATTRHIEQTFTFTAVEWVVSFRATTETMDGLELHANDGTSDFTAQFDLRDGSVDSVSGVTAGVIDLGDGEYECRVYFTPAAGTGFIRILGWDATADSTTYTGTNRTVVLSQATAHPSSATLRYDLFTAQECDTMAIAGHNLFTGGGRVLLEHDSNNDDTWTTIATVTPTDNSPIMLILEPLTSSRWRITVDRGVLPEIAVFRVGVALQMQRPFYSGFTVPRMDRQTETLGNISGSGELLGRSKKRSILNGQYSWTNLTYAWVRANLDTPTGLIQSIEAEPFFAAWRPGETDDVDYFMRGSVTAPSASGTRDLHSFSLSGEVHSYE